MASRARPRVHELRGRLVRLRPFAADEVDAAWRGIVVHRTASRPGWDDDHDRNRESTAFRRRLAHSGRLWRGCLDLAIERRGRPIGLIQARTSPQQTLPPGTFEVGIILFRPSDRGKGSGSEAVQLLTGWLFEQAGAGRVQATTTPENEPMRRAFEHLGFRREGILRGFFPAEAGRVDSILYGVTAGDWARHRPN